MEINVHRVKEVEAKFFNLADPWKFATIELEDNKGSTMSLFIQDTDEDHEFLQKLKGAVETVTLVLVDGAAPPADEEE